MYISFVLKKRLFFLLVMNLISRFFLLLKQKYIYILQRSFKFDIFYQKDTGLTQTFICYTLKDKMKIRVKYLKVNSNLDRYRIFQHIFVLY